MGNIKMSEAIMMNLPGLGRSPQARPVKRRAACRQAGVLVLLIGAAMAFGCDSSGTPPEESDIWDEMSWDDGSWALYPVSTLDTLG
jgi:hypothetical protein